MKVCKAQKSHAVDAGVKIAVENHAGDMHSTELAQLIEAAGKDYVGANLDSGNALWTLEDPLDSLENARPLRAHHQPARLGRLGDAKGRHGAMDRDGRRADRPEDLLRRRSRELCPGVPVHIETISGFNREFPYLTQEFWKAWPAMPAERFARFVALAKQGTSRPTSSPTRRRPQGGRADVSSARSNGA